MMGAQWLNGRVLDSRPRGRGFEPHRRHCVVVLEQDIPSLVLVQPRKTCPCLTERLLMGRKESNQTNKTPMKLIRQLICIFVFHMQQKLVFSGYVLHLEYYPSSSITLQTHRKQNPPRSSYFINIVKGFTSNLLSLHGKFHYEFSHSITFSSNLHLTHSQIQCKHDSIESWHQMLNDSSCRKHEILAACDR